MEIKTLSEKDKQDINRLLNLEVNDLYTELAQDIGDLGPIDDVKKLVDDWLNQRRAKLYDLICVQHDYCTFISANQNVRRIDIVGALADILSPFFGGIPLNTLSVLLVRCSLEDLCHCNK